jgi:hypothetical protein
MPNQRLDHSAHRLSCRAERKEQSVLPECASLDIVKIDVESAEVDPYTCDIPLIDGRPCQSVSDRDPVSACNSTPNYTRRSMRRNTSLVFIFVVSSQGLERVGRRADRLDARGPWRPRLGVADLDAAALPDRAAFSLAWVPAPFFTAAALARIRWLTDLAAAPESADEGQRTSEWLLRQRLQSALRPSRPGPVPRAPAQALLRRT